MMTQIPGPNGRVRKTLANQLDRLEELLEGFGPRLQQAIADAVQAAIGAAVREAAAQFRPEEPPAPKPAPPPAPEATVEPPQAPVPAPAESRFRRWARQALETVRQASGNAATRCRTAFRTVAAAVAPRAVAAKALVLSIAAALGVAVRAIVSLARGEPRATLWGLGAALAAIVVLECIHPIVLTVLGSLVLGAGVAGVVALFGRLRSAAPPWNGPTAN